MSIDNKLKTIQRSIDKLKAKGVTAIKIELEANLNRGGSDDHRYCESCDEGRVDCGNGCWWSYEQDRAVVNCPECIEEPDSDCEHCESTREVMCPDCYGEGRVDCDDCDGTGEYQSSDYNDYSDPATCKEYIFDRIADITGTERLSPEHHEAEEHNPFDWVKFARFYYDGSVDSEITLTIPLTLEAVKRLPAVVQAFRDLGDEVGNGIDTRGAGMHMALLFTEDCSYPDVAAEYTQDYIDRYREENFYSDDFPETSTRLPENMLNNFSKSMTQLLPALYFLGSPNATSRGLRYRMPVVSVGANGHKYSAVVYRLGSFEFRVFETCYDNPEAVLDNVVIMANSMRYLSDKYISPGVDKVASSIQFGSDSDNTVGRFYKTAEHLDALNIGLQRLKPDYYTIKQLKEARGFKYTKAHASNESKRITAIAERAYDEYSMRFDFAVKLQTEAHARNNLVRAINSMSIEELSQLEADRLLDEYIERERRFEERKQDKASYIKQVYDSNMQRIVGDYTLRFN